MKTIEVIARLVAVVALSVIAVTSVLILREQRQQTCFADIEAAAGISGFALQTAEGDAEVAKAQHDRDMLLSEIARTRTGCR